MKRFLFERTSTVKFNSTMNLNGLDEDAYSVRKSLLSNQKLDQPFGALDLNSGDDGFMMGAENTTNNKFVTESYMG